MARRLFTLASAVPLMLCVGVLALWAATHEVGWCATFSTDPPGRITSAPPEGWGEMASANGSLVYCRTFFDYGPGQPAPPVYWSAFRLDPRGRTPTMFLQYMYMEPGPTDFYFESGALGAGGPRFQAVAVPHWAAAAAAGALPLLWLGLRARGALAGRRRRTRGLCPSCGYAPHATPERCSECGAVRRGG